MSGSCVACSRVSRICVVPYGESSPQVEKVALSTRKITAPAILLTGQFGLTAAMERIAKSQALADERDMAYYMKAKVMQINYEHPTIIALRQLFEVRDPVVVFTMDLCCWSRYRGASDVVLAPLSCTHTRAPCVTGCFPFYSRRRTRILPLPKNWP